MAMFICQCVVRGCFHTTMWNWVFGTETVRSLKPYYAIRTIPTAMLHDRHRYSYLIDKEMEVRERTFYSGIAGI